MNKKIFFGVLIMIVILALFFYIWQVSKKNPEIKEKAKNQTQEEINLIMGEAIQAQNASLCKKLLKEEDKKRCETNVIIAEAGIKQDESLCDEIEEESARIVCKDNVVITKAMNSRDKGMCDSMTDKTRIEQCNSDVEKYLK